MLVDQQLVQIYIVYALAFPILVKGAIEQVLHNFESENIINNAELMKIFLDKFNTTIVNSFLSQILKF